MNNRIDRIAARAEAHVKAGAFGGIEWAVEQGGKDFASGHAGTLSGDAPIYRIYSMTKPVVSAVALMLMEEGKLRLMDPVAAYLPEFGKMEVHGQGAPNSMMVIEHLLTHRAGLSYGFLHGFCPVGEAMAGDDLFAAKHTLSDICDRIPSYGLAFDPGSKWRYSVATDVMGRILEIIEDKPLGKILHERVFEPLGLSDTAFHVPANQQHRVMPMFGQSDIDKLFDFEPGAQELTPIDSIEAGYPMGDPDFARGGLGLFSTLADYMKIARFLSTGKAGTQVLLSRKGQELLWLDRIPDSQKPMRLGPIALLGYGWGLAGRTCCDPGFAMGYTSHGEIGWAGAASTYFWIDPQEDLIGVVMAQYLGSKVPIGDDIRNAVYQALD